MLSQQMRSGYCVQLEAGNLQLSLLPSNSVGNYNNQNNNISNERSPVNSLLITDTNSLSSDAPMGHVVANNFYLDTISLSSDAPAGHVVANTFSLIEESIHLSSLHAPAGHSNYNLRSLFQIYFSFGRFSQSVACIATRFGECSSTLLDKLWYLYSYIYKPTTTI